MSTTGPAPGRDPADAPATGRHDAARSSAGAPLPGQPWWGGVLTGVAGLVVALATAAVLNERLSPVTAVAETVADLTPGPLAEELIGLVGTWDKPILVGGVVATVLGLAALAGRLAARSPWRGQLVLAALAALGLAGVVSQSGAVRSAVVPVLAGAATWVLLLPLLVGPPEDGPTDATTAGPRERHGGLARRTFLVRAGVVGVATVLVGVGGAVLGRGRRAVEAVRAGLRLGVSEGTVPAGADVGIEGVESWRVANDDFYRIDTAFALPTVDVDRWRLRVHGMVEREVTLSFADLLARETTEAWVTLCCVSNPVGGDLVGNAWWSGVRIAEVLAEAGPLPGADAVKQTSHDGWTCGTPLAALTDERDALLAVAMNGEPLPVEHGFPVRMVVPGLYGFVSATKWLVDLEVTRFADFAAFWTERGWAERAPVRTQSRIDVPGANRRVMAGSVPVGGVAWAQQTGIAGVEVRVDGGPWLPMDLGRVPSDDTWVQWGGTVQVSPGTHTIAVRATDKSGYTQTGVRRDVVPDGATGWHTVEFTAE